MGERVRWRGLDGVWGELGEHAGGGGGTAQGCRGCLRQPAPQSPLQRSAPAQRTARVFEAKQPQPRHVGLGGQQRQAAWTAQVSGWLRRRPSAASTPPPPFTALPWPQAGLPRHPHAAAAAAASPRTRFLGSDAPVAEEYRILASGSSSWISTTARAVCVGCEPPEGSRFFALWHCGVWSRVGCGVSVGSRADRRDSLLAELSPCRFRPGPTHTRSVHLPTRPTTRDPAHLIKDKQRRRLVVAVPTLALALAAAAPLEPVHDLGQARTGGHAHAPVLGGSACQRRLRVVRTRLLASQAADQQAADRMGREGVVRLSGGRTGMQGPRWGRPRAPGSELATARRGRKPHPNQAKTAPPTRPPVGDEKHAIAKLLQTLGCGHRLVALRFDGSRQRGGLRAPNFGACRHTMITSAAHPTSAPPMCSRPRPKQRTRGQMGTWAASTSFRSRAASWRRSAGGASAVRCVQRLPTATRDQRCSSQRCQAEANQVCHAHQSNRLSSAPDDTLTHSARRPPSAQCCLMSACLRWLGVQGAAGRGSRGGWARLRQQQQQ